MASVHQCFHTDRDRIIIAPQAGDKSYPSLACTWTVVIHKPTCRADMVATKSANRGTNRQRGEHTTRSWSQKSSPLAQRFGRFSTMIADRPPGRGTLRHLPVDADRISRWGCIVLAGAPQKQLNMRRLLPEEVCEEGGLLARSARGPARRAKPLAASESSATYTEFHASEALPVLSCTASRSMSTHACGGACVVARSKQLDEPGQALVPHEQRPWESSRRQRTLEASRKESGRPEEMRVLLLSQATRRDQQSTFTGRPRPTVLSMLGTYDVLFQYSSLKEPHPTEREMSLLLPRGAIASDTSGSVLDRTNAYTPHQGCAGELTVGETRAVGPPGSIPPLSLATPEDAARLRSGREVEGSLPGRWAALALGPELSRRWCKGM